MWRKSRKLVGVSAPPQEHSCYAGAGDSAYSDDSGSDFDNPTMKDTCKHVPKSNQTLRNDGFLLLPGVLREFLSQYSPFP